MKLAIGSRVQTVMEHDTGTVEGVRIYADGRVSYRVRFDTPQQMYPYSDEVVTEFWFTAEWIEEVEG